MKRHDSETVRFAIPHEMHGNFWHSLLNLAKARPPYPPGEVRVGRIPLA